MLLCLQGIAQEAATLTPQEVRRGADISPSERYAQHSVLQSGSWAKIRIAESGIYQLSAALIRKCGFSDISKVKVYGYGGALQPESLTGEYLKATDDLKEVPICVVGDKRLFYAVGTVTWESATATDRIRNNYSSYGYYFLTENDAEPATLSQEEFKDRYYPLADDYHSLYEVDDYAWFHGGRKLFDKTLYVIGTAQNYTLSANSTSGTIAVAMSYNNYFDATVEVNGKEIGKIIVSAEEIASARSKGDPIDYIDSYAKAADHTWTFKVENILEASNTIKITQTSGGEVRLDHISLTSEQPKALPDFTSTDFPVPEYVGNISNQDHHGDASADMIIIIPTSQKWLSQAERIKTLHETNDGLIVRIIPADELYNEFSSGTPDANAYRRYLKMLYDRQSGGQVPGATAQVPVPLTVPLTAPKYLLLFGDGAWDNRMLSSGWTSYSPDDFLLCYESENSFSSVYCFVSDDYFCLLDDGEQIQEKSGSGYTYTGRPDVAVGRMPCRTLDDAKTLTDKTVSYANNEYGGSWQNTIMFMGDDGNNNTHMTTADKVATMVQNKYPGYNINKVYWDAYTRQSSSTGNSYPDVTNLIKNQMSEGALIMNYSGHGINYALSHEFVVRTADFENTVSNNLPLWVTASCDIMPFDGQDDNIGEAAMLNKKGGAIAFFGTTRTVYSNYNEVINLGFSEYVLGYTNGKRNTIGEAARITKCELVDTRKDLTPNKLQYTLLGDPALTLAAPTQEIVIDEINGEPMTEETAIQLSAGSIATIKGHVLWDDDIDSDFNGIISASVKDAEETITCKMNDPGETDNPFVYKDRTKVIYRGYDNIQNGEFSLTFAVPKDISYNEGSGQMTLYALSNDKLREAHGETEGFVLNGSSIAVNDSIGPSIYCYLNSSTFKNGGVVNASPYFMAELYDDSGINASGSSIGHDLELIVDGDMLKTYNLNNHFNYDFGDYRSGKLGFSIPELNEGHHKLLFRAWDVLNNSSTAELDFEVKKDVAPNCLNVICKRNSGSSNLTFTITHDRAGSNINIQLDIYDTAGRQLWRHKESGMSTNDTYTFDWDQSVDGGRVLQTGVYIFKVSLSSDGGGESSKAIKQVITKK